MRLFKKITSILSAMIVIALLAFVIFMQLYPEETSKVVGFRFYTVLTDSMEPKIPTFSLVFSKTMDEDEPITPNSIVTFKANRFGEDILLTHYFRKTQEKDGTTYYRTQGANADDYDNYETKRSDIIGTYIFHVPYLGKIFLFLKSPFGFIMYGELCIVFLVNRLIRSRWEEKDRKITEKQDSLKVLKKLMRKKLPITDIEAVTYRNQTMRLTGKLTNDFDQPVHFVQALLTFYDKDKKEISKTKWYLCGKEGLQPKESCTFTYTMTDADIVDFYNIVIVSYK